MMAGIRGTNTKPELLIRSLLHKKGFRYRIHVKDLPGKPDIVLPKYRALLLASNWRVCIVWECSIRGARKDPEKVADTIEDWLSGTETFLEIRDYPGS